MAEPKKAAGGRLFHVVHGESGFMYAVDMRNALNLHPQEWKERPWTDEEIEAYHDSQAADTQPLADDDDEKEEKEKDDKPKRGRPKKAAD